MKNQVVFSGVQPTGILHIGNYLGAIKQFANLQFTSEAIFCVVDHHAISVPKSPQELHESTLNVVALYLACGIDPHKATIFLQSHVSEHTELAWILNTMTPIGELERMTQFKDKKQDPNMQRQSVLAGLLNYPTLMASDILLYKTNIVPVGEDQTQHIEFTRMIAEKFNKRYGNIFVLPEAHVQERGGRIMSLDDPRKKMSKSASSTASYISLLDSPDDIRRKIKIAVTDSSANGVRYDKNNKPAITNLIEIYSGFSEYPYFEVEKKYKDKKYDEFKTDLAELLVKKLVPIQEKYKELKKNQKEVYKVLVSGSRHASVMARKTLAEVKVKMGFVV